jgi:hypothetical protein
VELLASSINVKTVPFIQDSTPVIRISRKGQSVKRYTGLRSRVQPLARGSALIVPWLDCL